MTENFKRYLLNGVLLLVLLSSCKKDVSVEIQQENQTNFIELKSLVSQVKTWHDSTVSSNLSTKIQNGVRAFSVNENDIMPPIVDWEKAFINFDSSSVKSVTVPISMNYKTGEHMQLVATKSKNKINGYFIKVTPDSSYFANQIDIYNYTDFSGSIAVYNLMGIRIKKQDFKAGNIFSSNNSTKAGLSSNITYDVSPPCKGCNDVTVTVTGYRKKYYYTGYDYTLSYFHISYNQNFELDNFGGGGDGGDVFAGGGYENGDDIDYDYQFPINSNYKIIYPKFTNLVKNIYENSYKVPKLLGWLKAYSKLSDKDLFNILQFNQGPTIIIKDLNGPDWGGPTRYGHFDRNKKIIEIDIKLVTNYENGIFKNGDAYTIFLAATLLHETVHYGRYITGSFEYDGEYGNAFQLAANYGNFDLLDR